MPQAFAELKVKPDSSVQRQVVRMRRVARTSPVGVVGLVVVLVLASVATVGPIIAADPLEFNVSDRLQGPSQSAPFGTDDKGRDVMARTIHGTRVSLQVGVLAAAAGATLGLVFGLVTGYVGGVLDTLGQRLVDCFLAFPALLLSMAVTVALGQSKFSLTLALAAVTWPSASRIVRAVVITQGRLAYVEAARSVGASTPRILFVHILPNLFSIFLVVATAAVGQAILSEAALSFLGLGVPAPRPSLGGMVYEAQQWSTEAPWMAVFPGLVIASLVIGFNLLGDAVRDLLDPRQRER